MEKGANHATGIAGVQAGGLFVWFLVSGFWFLVSGFWFTAMHAAQHRAHPQSEIPKSEIVS
jgi:hypothetical protein